MLEGEHDGQFLSPPPGVFFPRMPHGFNLGRRPRLLPRLPCPVAGRPLGVAPGRSSVIKR